MQTSDGNTNDACSKPSSLKEWLKVLGYSLLLLVVFYLVTNYSDDFMRWCIEGQTSK